MKRILIVGGGIGGLTAAIALGRRGHAVTLLERSPTFAPVGAGIVLAANAIAILEALKVDLSAGFPTPSMDVCSVDGSTLSGLAIARHGWKVLAFHRAELHAALADALPPGVDLRLGEGLEGALPDDYDLVVGADGLRSRVRREVLGELPLRYSGETCWRAVVPGVEVPRVTETWGPASRMGVVPLSGGRVYVFMTRVAPADQPSPPWEDLKRHFSIFGGDCPAALARMDASMLLHHDLLELEAPVWGKGKVWLLGDAAHGMTPNQGQGACMAIEDAVALARVVDAGGGLEDYVALRHERVHKIQLDSRRFGQIAAWTNPIAVWARDTATRLTPESVMVSHYRQLVAPGMELAQSL